MMNEITSPNTLQKKAKRLSSLIDLFEKGQVSEATARSLDKIIEYEATLCQTRLDQIRTDLFVFEQQYGLASEEFYSQYQSGKTDDRMDYVEWASLIQMAANLKKRLEVLT